jgi:hypothetical protein
MIMQIMVVASAYEKISREFILPNKGSEMTPKILGS